MNKREKLLKTIPWLILAASLLGALAVIGVSSFIQPGSSSISTIMAILVALLPGLFVVGRRTRAGKEFGKRQLQSFSKLANRLSALLLLVNFSFLLIPFAHLRWQMKHQVWFTWLPVVILYGLLAISRVLVVWRSRGRTSSLQKTNSSRETFIDFARGFAIVLAVGSHAFYAFGYDVLFGAAMYKVMSITRLATPSFVLITGMMFELVYYRKAEKHGFKSMAKSLVSRALQCYLAYLITVLIEWFGLQLTTSEALRAAVFLGNSLFSGILQFYALFLLLAIAIIWLRKRFGIWLIASLPLLVWLVDPLFWRLTWPAADQPLGHLTALFFGHPAVSNFSVWHSLMFMSFGMLLGVVFKRSRQAGNYRDFQLTLLGLFAVCLLVSLASVIPLNGQDFFYLFSNEYRLQHRLPYYSIGSMGAFLLIWITWRMRRFLSKPWLEHTVTTLGKDSLWAFAVGNSLAAVLPVISHQTWYVVVFTLAVLGGSVLVIEGKKLIPIT